MVMGVSSELGENKLFDGGLLYLTRFLAKDPLILTTKRTFDNQTVEISFIRKCKVIHHLNFFK